MWAPGCAGSAKAVSAGPGSEPKAGAVSIPWAVEWLCAGVLLVAACRPTAAVTQPDGEDGPPSLIEKATRVCDRGKQNEISAYVSYWQIFFQREKTQTSQANLRNFFKMLWIPAWIPILILLILGMRQTMWLYIGLNKLVQKLFGESIFTCIQSLF